MKYYIDEKQHAERDYWVYLNGCATREQISWVMEGKPVIAGGMKFRIVFDENEEVIDTA